MGNSLSCMPYITHLCIFLCTKIPDLAPGGMMSQSIAITHQGAWNAGQRDQGNHHLPGKTSAAASSSLISPHFRDAVCLGCISVCGGRVLLKLLKCVLLLLGRQTSTKQPGLDLVSLKEGNKNGTAFGGKDTPLEASAAPEKLMTRASGTIIQARPLSSEAETCQAPTTQLNHLTLGSWDGSILWNGTQQNAKKQMTDKSTFV